MNSNPLHLKLTLFIITLSSFLVPFTGSSLNIAIYQIDKEFHLKAKFLTLLSLSFLLASGMFLVPFGKLADVLGKNKIFLSGILIFSFSSLFCGISTSSFFLIFFRFIQGIGGALIFSTSVAILAENFPKEKGKVLGINSAAVYSGLCLGPILGGFLVEKFTWRSIFYILFPLGLISFFGGIFVLREKLIKKSKIFDIFGSLIYIFTLSFISVGFSNLTSFKFQLIILGFLFLFVFIIWEKKSPNPILDFNLFYHNKVFTFSSLSAFISYVSTFGIPFLLSIFLQYIKGFSPQQTGWILLSQPLVMALFSPLAGKVSDKINPRKIAFAGMIMIFFGTLFFIFLTEKTTLKTIVFNLILLGIGMGFFVSPNTNAILRSTKKNFYGLASGILATMRILGQMVSLLLVTAIINFYLPQKEISLQNFELFLKASKIIFLTFTFFCILGIIFCIFPKAKN